MSHLPISENSKTALRKTAVEIRNSLPMQEISRKINAHIMNWALFQKAEIVLAYSAIRNEVDLLPLTTAFPDKQWYLPKVENDNLVFYRYIEDTVLTTGAYGVPEPVSEEVFTPIQATNPIFILVPGLRFDRQGYRLGYGKGYYDRFLHSLHQKSIPYLSVGTVPDALFIDHLPVEEHDIPVTWIVTESRLNPIEKISNSGNA